MNKAQAKNVLVVGLLIIIIGLSWFIFDSNRNTEDSTNQNPYHEKQMDLVVYLQNKEAAILSDCGVTDAQTIQVPETKMVADASLVYLFQHELGQYADYKSVTIENGVAKITLTNDEDPTGLRISSLSSCEARHLSKVLGDTLTQYETIKSIELYSPSGKIEF